jgi:DNA invertase Pin-like site-specific DNA recombinase
VICTEGRSNPAQFFREGDNLNYSYKRVSTEKQDERRQEISLEAYHIDPENQFVEKKSGKNANRPELQKLLEVVKDGDHIYVESISRFGRNVDDLRQLTEQLRANGVVVHFVKEGFDTSGHMYKFMLTILGAVAEMERELIVDRVKEGMEKAKRFGTKSGKKIGRPDIKIPDHFEKLYGKVQAGEITKVYMAKLLGVNRMTLYRWIKYYESRD